MTDGPAPARRVAARLAAAGVGIGLVVVVGLVVGSRPGAPLITGQATDAVQPVTEVTAGRTPDEPTDERSEGQAVDAGWLRPELGVAIGDRDDGDRVYVTGDAGRSWREITPEVLVGNPDRVVVDAYFLDRDRGWVAAMEPAASDSWLSRTMDGGKTWRTTAGIVPADHHAGTDWQLRFVDPDHGWLYFFVPASGGLPTLRSTDDGGETWTDAVEMPEPGRISIHTPDQGWLGGDPWSPPGEGEEGDADLHRSDDGGRTWARMTFPLANGWETERTFADVPTFLDEANGVLPVTHVGDGSVQVAFYRSDDAGRTWNLEAVVATDHAIDPSVVTRSGPFGRQTIPVATSITSGDNWWIAASTEDGIDIRLTTDGGDTWRRHRSDISNASKIEAIDADTAWVTTDNGLHATYNGGRDWQRLTVAGSG